MSSDTYGERGEAATGQNGEVRLREVVSELLRRCWSSSIEGAKIIVVFVVLIGPPAVVGILTFAAIGAAPNYEGTVVEQVSRGLTAVCMALLALYATAMTMDWLLNAWDDARRTVKRRKENAE